MGTSLNVGGGSSLPSLKLRSVGEFADFAVIDIAKVPRYVFGTQQVRVDPQGKPQTQDKLTVLVIGGSAVISDDKENLTPRGTPGDRPAEADEVAVVYFAGLDRWDPDKDKFRQGDVGRSFSDACQAVGGLQVGDVGRWCFEAEEPGQGAQPRRIRTVQFRRPRPDESERSAKCEALHAEGRKIQLTEGPFDDNGPTPTPAAAPPAKQYADQF